MKIVKIMKFGGSSVGSAERIKNVAKIVLDSHKKGGVAVVVSAMQGVTDKLLALDLDFVKEKHLTAAKELKVSAPTELLSELEGVIKGIKLLGDAYPMTLDLVVSFGERLSAHLVSAYLNKKNPSVAVDSRELVKTDSNFQNAAVDFTATNQNIKRFFSKLFPKPYSLNPIPVITGFISSDTAGKTTTLGRGGSDYSGAIFGASLGAEAIEIWTDADGVMTADPRIVKAAFTLPEISYEEAFEMAYFGAKVIHPATMLPAIKKGIPVLIKNTFNPRHPGTVVGKLKGKSKKLKVVENPVKNISAIDGISLISIGGTELAGMPGTAERVFRAAADAKANVILIAQASSEHTICLAVKRLEADRAVAAIKSEFESDIRKGKVAVERKDGQSIVAVVGDNMRGVPGIAGKIFNSLGNAKINISAIAQGGSERNISLAVDEAKKADAINALHKEFFAIPRDSKVFLVGTGVVGGELLKQLAGTRHQALGIGVCGIADIEKMVLSEAGVDLKNWKKILVNGAKADLREFVRLAAEMKGEKIFVDCTASEKIAKMYPRLVKLGFHIVTPNKKFNVLSHKEYAGLRSLLAAHKKSFHYDANVGAGLPVISTIKNLLAAGDEIKKVEGVFSGTLSYLFNNFDGKRKFSDLVAQAKALGYTEPDPREDLSGQDVGRKLLILARETGLSAELADVKLESLVKPDSYFAARIKKAKAKKSVLRYVATAQNGRMSASLKEVSIDNPLASLSGADNIFAIYTKYYKNPLVIRGAGAGAEVTAAAVLNGILRIVRKV